MIIDDAHREPGRLNALATLLTDQRFDLVSVVLTVRPGFVDGVLGSAGVRDVGHSIMILKALEREHIDRIIKDHGIAQTRFRTTVIGLAEGSPLIVHAACEVALQAGSFSWTDAADVLRQRVAARLLPSNQDRHRAALVALALLGSAASGRDLGELHDCITMLPERSDELDRLLADLADAGLASGDPCVVRPAVLAPVLVADALDTSARVRIHMGRTLDALHEAARAKSGAYVSDVVLSDEPEQLQLALHHLTPQWGVLAGALLHRPDATAARLLSEHVLRLLPDSADLATWDAVLKAAQEVAPAAPHLMGALAGRLITQWPPKPSPPWYGKEPVGQYQFEAGLAAQRFGALALRTDPAGPYRVVGPLLDVVWLFAPALADGAALRRALETVRGWSAGGVNGAIEVEELLVLRQALVAAVVHWGRDRRQEPPAGLDQAEADMRGERIIARVQMLALEPFLSLVVERFTFGSPTDAAEGTLFTWLLPDDSRTSDLLNKALSALIEIFEAQFPLTGEDNSTFLRSVVERPRELRAEGARPLPGSGSKIPGYARALLEGAATKLERAIVDRWNDLPLNVRRSAAKAALGPNESRLDLARAAASGSKVASAAQADDLLASLLVVQPLPTYGLGTLADIQLRAERAAEYGAGLPTGQALLLLQQVDITDSVEMALPSFARAVGENAHDVQSILQALTEHPYLAGGEALLMGLAASHPAPVFEWLQARLGNPRFAEFSLLVADSLPDWQPDLHCSFVSQLKAGLSGGESEAVASATSFADHSARCTLPRVVRLQLLTELGASCPAAALPRILWAIGITIGFSQLTVEENVSRHQTVQVLGRRLRESEAISQSIYDDDDTASGAAALASIAPEEVTAVLAERAGVLDGTPVIPEPWHQPLRDLPTEIGERLAASFLGQFKYGAEMESQTEASDRIAEAFAVLGRGTVAFERVVRDWAEGGPSHRRRAALAIRGMWEDPIWTEILPNLLAIGLDSSTIQDLIYALLPTTISPDLDDHVARRLVALDCLRDDRRPAVQDFVADAERRLQQRAESHRRAEDAFHRGYE
ncbi:hypothetical protein [Streptacidiphilus sp. MAP12-16]|uniref:hypothetical protein n=1 Tax=Streptacidiphilus sp. MAP12-16 TaxID=3156300 RepID=UPI003513CB95